MDQVRTIGHPYKNSRSALQKLIHKLAGRNPSVLVVCERDSYLLSALDHLPGVQTHLTADVVVDGMSCWAKTAPPFDVCLLEVARVGSNALEIIDAVVPKLRQGDSRILLLWHDRMLVDLRATVIEIMKISNSSRICLRS